MEWTLLYTAVVEDVDIHWDEEVLEDDEECWDGKKTNPNPTKPQPNQFKICLRIHLFCFVCFETVQ